MQKRIMILGGNSAQALATERAKALGLYVVSADAHADCPGHKIADEACLIDIADPEVVLREARRLRIDGIISYTSDQLATVAASVAQQLRLPGNGYDVTYTMNHKHLFRDFMRRHGFRTPQGACCQSVEEAVEVLRRIARPCMMKPSDSSASRGVFRVETEQEVREHWQESLSFSAVGMVVVEEFIDFCGIQQDGDLFVVDGEIVFWKFTDQLKDVKLSPYMPYIHRLPTTMPASKETEALREARRLLQLLGYRNGPCNMEYNVDVQGNVYILEIGPRNSGNLIPQATEAVTGFSITDATLLQAVGLNPLQETLQKQQTETPFALTILIHTDRAGRFTGLDVEPWARPYVRVLFLLKAVGSPVRPYLNGRDAIGMAMLAFPTQELQQRAQSSPPFLVHVQPA